MGIPGSNFTGCGWLRHSAAKVKTADFLIAGGGVIGICVARELKRRYSDASVTVLEKEPQCGLHASGRNSGVIHAGFYYSADSLKAKFTREGNLALTGFCEDEKIPLNRCGKLVVAQSEQDLPQLDELLRRAQRNSVPLESISAEEARKIEPRVKTVERALFSPSTKTADPLSILAALFRCAESEGIKFQTGVSYVRRSKGGVETSAGSRECGYFVNAAGLYADRIALEHGFSEHYRILPFKGLYLYSNEAAGAFRTNIYPVPDLRNPFLGVHFTVSVDGKAKIGPTAIPAFWREQYKVTERFNFSELLEIVWRSCGLFASANFDFRRLAMEELRKYSRPHLVGLAARLAEGVSAGQYTKWGKPGIRAQLLDLRTRKLEMDFVLEGDSKSFHVLNAVSPAWTCSIPFSKYICDKIEALLR
jgi:L-2-hydroxyglutarate oxidase